MEVINEAQVGIHPHFHEINLEPFRAGEWGRMRREEVHTSLASGGSEPPEAPGQGCEPAASLSIITPILSFFSLCASVQLSNWFYVPLFADWIPATRQSRLTPSAASWKSKASGRSLLCFIARPSIYISVSPPLRGAKPPLPGLSVICHSRLLFSPLTMTYSRARGESGIAFCCRNQKPRDGQPRGQGAPLRP